MQSSTRKTMQNVVIALMPACLFGIYNFGIRALLIILLSILSCAVTEYVFLKINKKPIPPSDYSEVVTGILLGLNLSVNVPLWIPIIGGIFAIWIVKMLYGGVGQNFMNPTLAARCFLLISFPARMSNYAIEAISKNANILSKVHSGAVAIDAVAGPTPLSVLKAGGNVDLFNMLVGNIGGAIGETSAIAILLGVAYLLTKKIISFRIPFIYIISFAITVVIFGDKGMDVNFVLAHILGGGLLFAACFMATDPTTSPKSVKGQVIYGVLLGLVTGAFRIFGASPESTSYAIIIGNMLVPLINKVSSPKSSGKERLQNV